MIYGLCLLLVTVWKLPCDRREAFFSNLFWEIMVGIELSYIAFPYKIENFFLARVYKKGKKYRARQDMKRTMDITKRMWDLVHGRGRAQLSYFMLWPSSPSNESCPTHPNPRVFSLELHLYWLL